MSDRQNKCWGTAMTVKFRPIARRSTVDEVVERIRAVIEERELAAGMRLPGEFALVQQLQVSRSVLREALARLQSMGLVSIQRGRGTFVGNGASLGDCVRLLQTAVTLSPRELLSYAELRTAIEIQAARQAALRVTQPQLVELQVLLDALEGENCPYPEMLELDFRFHRKVVEIAGNSLMANLMEVIYEFVLAQMARTTPEPREHRLGRQLHQSIVDALAAHDPDAAERAMRSHMDAVLERLRTYAENKEIPLDTPHGALENAVLDQSNTPNSSPLRATAKSASKTEKKGVQP